jgi:hypothetical protein
LPRREYDSGGPDDRILVVRPAVFLTYFPAAESTIPWMSLSDSRYPVDMKQARVDFEDATWAALQHIAGLRGIEVSDLIRAAVEEKYIHSACEWVEAFRTWKAPWYDIEDSDEYVRAS